MYSITIIVYNKVELLLLVVYLLGIDNSLIKRLINQGSISK